MQRSQASAELGAIERLADAVGEAWVNGGSASGTEATGRGARRQAED
jgi:hypothetical protein